MQAVRSTNVPEWFSGNIGFHHIHHLSPRIPNYHFGEVPPARQGEASDHRLIVTEVLHKQLADLRPANVVELAHSAPPAVTAGDTPYSKVLLGRIAWMK